MSIIQGISKSSAATFEIEQSIRFNEDDSAHLDRTPSTASNRNTFTFSVWIKRGRLTSHGNILSAGSNSNDFTFLSFINDKIHFADWNGSYAWQLVSTAVFRDPGAWYNIVAKYDDTQSTASDRVEIYVNGSKITAYDTESYPSQNYGNTEINSTDEHTFGKQTAGSGANDLFDGYMAEIVLVDGTALDASSFGETDSSTGQWVPKDVSSLTFGTNGFHITGEDSTFLGQDVRTSGDQVNSFQASQWTGATGSYTFSDGRIEANTDNKAIKSVDTFTGDFEFSWRYIDMANFVIGFYEIDEDSTFSDSSSAGNMQNMTDSWYVQTSSVSANRDIFYGGAVQVNATTIANGDTWKLQRSSGTIKVYRNGSVVHTFSQTSTNEVRLVVAQGDASADVGQVNWVDNATLGNNFFSSGLSTADQVNDSPTSNHCTLNPLNKDTDCTLSDGNLQVGWTSGTDPIICGTMAVSSGKWYYEATFTGTFNFPAVGIAPAELSFGGSAFSSGNGALFYYAPSGNYRGNGDNVSYGAEYFVSSKIGVALNLDDNEITFFKDNSSQGTLNLATIRSGYSTWVPLVTGGGSIENIIVNFGQTAFNYTPPTGFKAWSVDNMVNPTIADPSKHFDTQLYTGNNTDDRAITGYNFSPDWVWIKARNQAYSHNITDIVRGAGKYIQSNTTDAEVTGPGAFGSTGSFTSDGFTLKNGSSGNLFVNDGSTNYVAWAWEANGTGSSNTDGSINTTSTSVNTTAGFSISTYTGTGLNATVGHGLGTAPSVILVKERTSGSVENWEGFFSAIGPTKTLSLNKNAAEQTSSTRWNDTSPTSSVFSIGTATAVNDSSGQYVAYCFADVEGYSKFGSYEGNGSADGTFVHTGFKPAFLLIKNIDASESWNLRDSARDPFNVTKQILHSNSNAAESTSGGGQFIDLLSNGFKCRGSDPGINSSATFIYMAFAETPFKTSTAR